MRAYAPATNKGRTVSGNDIHHKTADQLQEAARNALSKLDVQVLVSEN